MMTNTQEYEVAKLSDYGYRDHKVLKKTWSIISTILVVIIIFMIYLSILVIALQSFNSSSEVMTFTSMTGKWYLHMFDEPSFAVPVRNTFIISIAASLLATLLGTLVAVGIHYSSKKLHQKIMLLNNIPLLNADIVTGISIMLIFSLIMKIPWFQYIFGFPTMLVAHLYFCLPYVILNVIPKLKEMDPNMMDAALDLGLKPHKSLIKVIVPAIRSGILAGLIFAFTMSFDDFVISYYTTGNGFNNLSIWVYSSIGRKAMKPYVHAFSTLVTFGSMVVLLLINFFLNRKGGQNVKKKH